MKKEWNFKVYQQDEIINLNKKIDFFSWVTRKKHYRKNEVMTKNTMNDFHQLLIHTPGILKEDFLLPPFHAYRIVYVYKQMLLVESYESDSIEYHESLREWLNDVYQLSLEALLPDTTKEIHQPFVKLNLDNKRVLYKIPHHTFDVQLYKSSRLQLCLEFDENDLDYKNNQQLSTIMYDLENGNSQLVFRDLFRELNETLLHLKKVFNKK